MLGGWSLVVARSAEELTAPGEEGEERPRGGEAQWQGPNAPYNEGSRWGSALKPWTDELGMEGGWPSRQVPSWSDELGCAQPVPVNERRQAARR